MINTPPFEVAVLIVTGAYLALAAVIGGIQWLASRIKMRPENGSKYGNS